MDESPKFSLLDEPIVRARLSKDGRLVAMSLPQLLEALGRDDVRDFPALRPHQRAAWHALLVQLGALALGARDDVFVDEDQSIQSAASWWRLLVELTQSTTDPEAAWCLIQPVADPAFLQAGDPNAVVSKWKPIDTPDALDMLVTSRNHDLKAAQMRQAQPDDWLFALATLQTQEGVMGNGNYGIARMNRGYGNRASVGIAPPGGIGSRWRRDVAVAIGARDDCIDRIGFAEQDGIALCWLVPWDGKQSLQIDQLDPLFIEVCRRVRLVWKGDRIGALGVGSDVARIDAALRKGDLGDLWMPIDRQDKEIKALTVNARGFDYRRMAEVLYDGSKYAKPPCLLPQKSDPPSGLDAVARAVTRGQGKTEGYHERRVPIPAKARAALAAGHTEPLAACARERIETIRTFSFNLLKPSLMLLFEGGPDKINYDAKTVTAQVEAYLTRFEQSEDRRFFDDLNAEIEADDQPSVRKGWLIGLRDRAETVLRDAFDSGPQSHARRWRARSAALRFFFGNARKFFPLAFAVSSQPAGNPSASAAERFVP